MDWSSGPSDDGIKTPEEIASSSSIFHGSNPPSNSYIDSEGNIIPEKYRSKSSSSSAPASYDFGGTTLNFDKFMTEAIAEFLSRKKRKRKPTTLAINATSKTTKKSRLTTKWIHPKRRSTRPPIKLVPSDSQEEVITYFTHNYDRQYKEFYKWYYDVIHDQEGNQKRDIAEEKIPSTRDYRELVSSTPFPIPEEHQKYYFYIQDLNKFIEENNITAEITK